MTSGNHPAGHLGFALLGYFAEVFRADADVPWDILLLRGVRTDCDLMDSLDYGFGFFTVCSFKLRTAIRRTRSTVLQRIVFVVPAIDTLAADGNWRVSTLGRFG